MTFIIIAFFWISLVIIFALAAKDKGHPFQSYFLLGLFFSPIVSFMVLLVCGENKEELRIRNIKNINSKICPFCDNEIRVKATVCQYCCRDLPNIPTTTDETKN